MSYAPAPHLSVDEPDRDLRDAVGSIGPKRTGIGVRDDMASPAGGAVLHSAAEAVFISEPLGCARQARYLVAQVTPRYMRLYRTSALWIALEVRNAWQRGDFKVDVGDVRRLPVQPKQLTG